MNKRIAVIGASGMIGKPVAVELVKAGFEVTALARDPKRLSKMLPAQVKVIKGDIKNTGDILQLLQGQDFLYINLNLKPEEKEGDWHAETDGLKNILAAAAKVKIKRLAFISSIVMRYQGMNNFHWWVFDVKHEAIKLIKGSGLTHTIFYPSAFMENFNSNYRRGNALMLAGEAKSKMYYIAGADFGRAVAKSFDNLSSDNKEYDIQGPEAYSPDEAAAAFIKYYKKDKLKISKAPLGLLKFFGLFSQKMHYTSHIIEALNNYPENFTSEVSWKELGKPTITLRDFAEGKG